MTNHYEKLGRLLAAYHQLEVGLRLYLLILDEQSGAIQPPIDYVKLKQGEEVVEDRMTNYASLGDLVTAYNRSIKQHSDLHLQVDSEVVPVRDLVAHGRVLTSGHSMKNLKIIKFSRPEDGKVRVERAAAFNDKWYNRVGKKVDDANTNVIAAIQKYKPVNILIAVADGIVVMNPDLRAG